MSVIETRINIEGDYLVHTLIEDGIFKHQRLFFIESIRPTNLKLIFKLRYTTDGKIKDGFDYRTKTFISDEKLEEFKRTLAEHYQRENKKN